MDTKTIKQKLIAMNNSYMRLWPLFYKLSHFDKDPLSQALSKPLWSNFRGFVKIVGECSKDILEEIENDKERNRND